MSLNSFTIVIFANASSGSYRGLSIITSFLRTKEDDTFCSVYSVVLKLAYQSCRLQLTTYGFVFVYLFGDVEKHFLVLRVRR